MPYPRMTPPMPGGLRLRAVQPLTDRDGRSCPLLFDIERSQLVGVPADFHLHAREALETGDLDDDLFGWLAAEDLLTYEAAPAPPRWRPAGDLPAGLGRVWFGEDEVHCQPAVGGGRATLAALASLLGSIDGGARLVLHLAGEGGSPAALRGLVRATRRLAGRRGRRVAFELTTDGRRLTAATARVLAEHEILVRLTREHAAALDLLLAHLPDRTTLCVALDTGDRLAGLWRRAASRGVRRLHAVKVADRPPAAGTTPAAELHLFRRDLFAIADATFEALAAGQVPEPLYEPLARVVRRQLSGRPAAVGAGGSAGYLGFLAAGGLLPLLGPGAPGRPAVGGAADAEEGCRGCWARRLCERSRGCVAADCGGARPLPGPVRCEFWRAEVEVGLLLYHRLERADPASFLGLTQQRPDEPLFDPYPFSGGGELEAC